MAIFKIFPEIDAFIASNASIENTGLDEILELGAYPDLTGTGHSSRVLLKFSDQDLDKVKTLVSGSSFTSHLKLYLADAYEIPTSYTVVAAPIYLPEGSDWIQGTGKAGDTPTNTSGVSWEYTNPLTKWPTAYPLEVTASYVTVVGGGTWYTNLLSSQDHTVRSTHDLNIDVTQATLSIQNLEIPNKGFILKLSDELDFNTGTPIRLKYFSKNTNTIYPPVLEFAWDDSQIDSTLSEIETDLMTLRLINGKPIYKTGTKQRFRLAVRPKFPSRRFSIVSIYTENYRLPEESYWGIKDEYTEEMVVDFSLIGTKVSADDKSSYFDIYMDGLQPERYYRVLVKTTVDGSEVVVPLEEPFKVVRNA